MTVRVLVGDCRETLATLPAGSVHCIVTSPPYYGLRDYGEAAQIGLEDTPDAYVAEMVGVFRELRRVLRDDGVAWLNLGDSYTGGGGYAPDAPSNQPEAQAARNAPMAERSGARIAGRRNRSDVSAGNLLGIPWRVAFALQSDGWTLRDACVWHKPNPMPESVAGTRWEGDTLRRGSWRHTSAHEMVFMLTRGMGYFSDQEAVREAGSENVPWSASSNGGKKQEQLGNNIGNKLGAPAAPSGRNPRNVWSITTRPYSGAHFATMPPDLAERCIKAATSATGVCPACGAQWAPVVERGELAGEAKIQLGPRPAADARGVSASGLARTNGRTWREIDVLDHRPTCDCPPADPIPATVLDPFGGAGTTALVADRLGRDAILCELNADYAELARARISGDAPLLASVEVVA